MIVIANAVGFYDGKRRRAGDVFEVKDGAKSSWFSAVAKDTKPANKPEQKETETFAELNKQDAEAEDKAIASKMAGGKPA